MTEAGAAERVYIGLGSNLDSPLLQVHAALEALAQLPDTTLADASPLYRSAPLGPAGQPDYINGAAALDTRLPPESLLDYLQQIELTQGRERGERWGPRTLDLDILLFGRQQIQTQRLTVPHPEIGNREFVLRPLHDLAPDLTLPDGRAIAELLAQCPDHRLRPVPAQRLS
ncbi:2-amino-4-hydroxy-6-hydroxymethyldihydropteridine diphosphokinase [Marinobacteraceae bacterium S3BR75-40.1]